MNVNAIKMPTHFMGFGPTRLVTDFAAPRSHRVFLPDSSSKENRFMNQPMDIHSSQHQDNASSAPATAGKNATRKLDLSRLEPPADLEECSIEEMTIDGICGVY